MGYRPIALLSTLEKLYSMCLMTKCENRLEVKGPQYVYRKFHQPTDVILSLRMLTEQAL